MPVHYARSVLVQIPKIKEFPINGLGEVNKSNATGVTWRMLNAL